MLHPGLVLLARHPDLIADHVAAYADLATAEAQAWGRQVRIRTWLTLAATLMLTLAVALAGVAGLLSATVPAEQMPHPTWLWAIPTIPLVLSGVLGGMAYRTPVPSPWRNLREQVAIDAATLRLLTSPT